MNELSDILIENKELKERESNLEQELQGLGMDFDVVVQYAKRLEMIIEDEIDKDRLKALKAREWERYGNIAGLFKEEQ
jgi:hypothetical protein